MIKNRIQIIILIGSLIPLLFSCFNKGYSDIKIDGETYKFGQVYQGDDVKFSFIYINTGTGELVINDLYISCECMEVTKYDKKIKPGEKGILYGIIHTKGFMGNVTKAIKMKTNIPDTEPILVIQGTIIPRPE